MQRCNSPTDVAVDLWSTVRQALHRTALRVLGIALFGMLLAGCAPQSAPRQEGPTPGVLRYAETDEPDTLNPLLSTKAISADVGYLAFSYFFDVDSRGQFVPDIATAVPTPRNGGISRDGKTIVYHLRRGVTWQDGQPLTARDVVYTYRAMMNPKNGVESRVGYDQIARIDAPDPQTIVLHMRVPFSPIIAVFMGVQGGTPILPAHLLPKSANLSGSPYNDRPVGSGPFKVTQWLPGDRVVFDANPSYWRGRPKLTRIVFRKAASAAGALDLLRRNAIDAWLRAEPTDYPQLSALSDYSVHLSPENVIDHIDFNTRNSQLSDVRVRRAIKDAIDRDRLVRDVTAGIYQTTDSDQQFFSWAYDPSVPKMRYNPALARTLLDEAGWKAGADGLRRRAGRELRLEFAYIEGQGTGPAVGAALRDDLEAVGIAVAPHPYPDERMFAPARDGGILNSGRYDIAYFGWVFDVDPDDSSEYACNQKPPAGQNSLFWCDATVDRAEADALATFDVQRRKRDYALIQREIASQVPTIFLFAERSVDVYAKRFSGFAPSPGESSFWNAWDWSMQ